MLEIRVLNSLKEVSEENWNACFSGVVENYGYLLATEKSGIQGFRLIYVTAWRDDHLIAAMPGFLIHYPLDTTLQGTLKKITTSITRYFPKLMCLKLACLGSPCTESGLVGFHTQLSDSEKPIIIEKILSGFMAYAAQTGVSLCGIKDIPEQSEKFWQPALKNFKFARLPGMPTAHLDIDFNSMESYMARLSSATRKDMRRKQRSLKDVEISTTTNVDAVLPRIMQLYNDTRGRSEWQFEDLSETFFTDVLATMPGQSYCTLYQVRGEIMAANLLIHDDQTLIDKFFCMDFHQGKHYNLYFLSWFNNIQTCLAHGFTRYQSGQAYYSNKLRLGSQLTRNNIYFKHANPLLQKLLIWVSPYFSADETQKMPR